MSHEAINVPCTCGPGPCSPNCLVCSDGNCPMETAEAVSSPSSSSGTVDIAAFERACKGVVEERAAKMRALEAADRANSEGRKSERDRIVKWMRSISLDGSSVRYVPSMIERGDHWK